MALALTPKTRLEENIGRITRRLLIDAATYANRAQLMQNGNGDKSRKVVVALLYMQAAQAIESVININSALDQKKRSELSQSLISYYSKARILLEIAGEHGITADCHFKLAGVFQKLDDDKESARHTALGLRALIKTSQRDRVNMLLKTDPERGRKNAIIRERYAAAIG